MENSVEFNEIPWNFPCNTMGNFHEKKVKCLNSVEFRGKFHGIPWNFPWNFMKLRLMEFNGIPRIS
jgi:hypothetical protein